MKNHTIILFFIFYAIPNFGVENIIKNIQNFYNNKEYGITVQKGILVLEDSFINILKESYKELPYTHKIITSNQNYSLDMQNNQINYNTYITYLFDYNSNHRLQLSLIYAFEEVSYYKTYIDNIHYTTMSTKMPVFRLKTPSSGAFLWNIEESTAYYVFRFPSTQTTQKKSKDIIPGLLLKIQFSKSTKYNQQIDNIINQLISSINWKNLQKLYKMN